MSIQISIINKGFYLSRTIFANILEKCMFYLGFIKACLYNILLPENTGFHENLNSLSYAPHVQNLLCDQIGTLVTFSKQSLTQRKVIFRAQIEYMSKP